MDMDAVHWKKIQRVVPWLLPEGEPPENEEYKVPAEAMIDVTQSMACIQCGVCVSACLSLEVDPELHRSRRAGQGLPLRGRPARRPHRGAPARPRRGPARHLRLHPLLRLHRGLPQGRGADVADHAPAPARHGRLRDQGRQQRLRPREGLRGHHREVGHAARGAAAAALVRPGLDDPRPARAGRRQAAPARHAHRPARPAQSARSRPRRRCCTPSCRTRRTSSASSRRSRARTSASSSTSTSPATRATSPNRRGGHE